MKSGVITDDEQDSILVAPELKMVVLMDIELYSIAQIGIVYPIIFSHKHHMVSRSRKFIVGRQLPSSPGPCCTEPPARADRRGREAENMSRSGPAGNRKLTPNAYAVTVLWKLDCRNTESVEKVEGSVAETKTTQMPNLPT